MASWPLRRVPIDLYADNFPGGRKVFSIWTVLFSGFGCLACHRDAELTRSGRDFFGAQREKKTLSESSTSRPILRVAAMGVDVEEPSLPRAKALERSRLWRLTTQPPSL